MNRKTVLIIGTVLVVLVVGASLAYYYSFVVSKKGIAERCENYTPNWENFIECYGVVEITDAWDVDYLSLKDYVHGYEVARVYNTDQYIYVNGKLYVINKNTIEGQTSNGERIQYYQELFQNGKITTSYYNSVSDIPTYLVIDTNSGEVGTYKNIVEVPKIEKEYFSNIENN